MDKAKIEIKVGIVEFAGEGQQDWLSKQLEKVLEKVPELLKIELANPAITPQSLTNEASASNAKVQPDSTATPSNFVTYLRDKNATSNQVNKFLVTATFLQLNGKKGITTTEVASTLKSANQSRLSNASDALNKNVGKGFCEKDGSQFFVTQEGIDYVNKMK
tara:strand:+ start:496 stop:981 length:486 start_codon:yes stop_codon:yes gene_type:complete